MRAGADGVVRRVAVAVAAAVARGAHQVKVFEAVDDALEMGDLDVVERHDEPLPRRGGWEEGA